MALVGKYFDESELCCHGDDPENYEAYGYTEGCGCGFSCITTEGLIRLVDAVCERLGNPNQEEGEFPAIKFQATCSYRCPVHNRRVGGVPNSQHVEGFAIDAIVPAGYDVDSFADLIQSVMEELGQPGGIGRYYDEGFVHFDDRGYWAFW